MANEQNNTNIAKEEQYNGWTNYETWAVSLWIDNEESTQTYWRQEAARETEQAVNCQMVEDGTWTIKEAARFSLAERLKEEITDTAPEMTASVYSDLLQRSLDRVNWKEIAHNLIDDITE